jgi:hypothetical protein
MHIIDKVLRLPSNFDATVTEARLSGFAQVLSEIPPPAQLNAVFTNESDWTMYVHFDELGSFAPSKISPPAQRGTDDISKISSFAPNSNHIPTEGMSEQNVYDFEAYHFLQGQVKYSTDLTNRLKFRTLEGKDLTITVLENGTIYVNDVRLISPDYLMAKGVIHLIDT